MLNLLKRFICQHDLSLPWPIYGVNYETYFLWASKKKRWKDFRSHRKCYDLVLILFMFLVCSPCNEQLKIQIYDHSLVPIPMWCEERWVLKPTSSPFSLPSWPLTSSHKHPTPNHHSLIKSFIHRPSSTRPYLSSGYWSLS